jgi:hypothetical protein
MHGGPGLSDSGAAALAAALGAAPALTHLSLVACAVHDAGATALARALPGSGLRQLDLGMNTITGSWGTGFSSPAGPKGELVAAWRRKHGEKACVGMAITAGNLSVND